MFWCCGRRFSLSSAIPPHTPPLFFSSAPSSSPVQPLAGLSHGQGRRGEKRRGGGLTRGARQGSKSWDWAQLLVSPLFRLSRPSHSPLMSKASFTSRLSFCERPPQPQLPPLWSSSEANRADVVNRILDLLFSSRSAASSLFSPMFWLSKI